MAVVAKVNVLHNGKEYKAGEIIPDAVFGKSINTLGEEIDQLKLLLSSGAVELKEAPKKEQGKKKDKE